MASPNQNRTPNYSLRHRNLLMLGVVVGVLFAGWLIVLRPVLASLRALPDQEVLKVASQVLEADLKNLATMNKQYSELASRDLARLDLVLPRGQDIPTLLAQFDGLAQTSKMTLDGLAIVGATEAPESRLVRNEAGEVVGVQESSGGSSAMEQVRDLQVNVSLINGTYAGLKQFIGAAAEAARFLNLTSLTFITGQESTSYNLSFRTSYLP